MKKSTLVIAALVFAVLTGCSQKKDLSTEEPSTNIEAPVESPEKSETVMLRELANQEFTLETDQLGEEDYDSMSNFGKSFVNLYSGAVSKQERVSFNKYISNERLLQFTNKMLELEQKRVSNGGSGVIFGLDNEFQEVEFQRLDSNLYRLDLAYSNQGSGMGCKLLIQSVNKSLKIVDLYFGNKDGLDTMATGHPQERKLDNPGLWDDQAWVEGVMAKLEEYETKLGN